MNISPAHDLDFIPPQLQLHPLRVAALGKIIGDSTRTQPQEVFPPACFRHGQYNQI